MNYLKAYYNVLKDQFGDEVANHFATSSYVSPFIEKDDTLGYLQLNNINRYLTSILFTYSGMKQRSYNDVLYTITQDTDPEGWYSLLLMGPTKFFYDNNVFGEVLGLTTKAGGA